MADKAPTYKAILKYFESRSDQVRGYFYDLGYLLNDGYSYEIILAYLFLKVEQAQNRALYGGVVKIHRGQAIFCKRIINQQHLTRDGFKDLYKNIFGHPVNKETSEKIETAEKIRDKVIHGKTIPAKEQRTAIIDVLDYAESLNQDIHQIAGFKPFGSMKGFKGRADSLDTRTTKWVMRGLGFGVKA